MPGKSYFKVLRYLGLFCRNNWWVENNIISYQRSVGTHGAIPVLLRYIAPPNQFQMRLKFFYTHLKTFPSGDAFPDFEYSGLHHVPGLLHKKKHHSHLATQKNGNK